MHVVVRVAFLRSMAQLVSPSIWVRHNCAGAHHSFLSQFLWYPRRESCLLAEMCRWRADVIYSDYMTMWLCVWHPKLDSLQSQVGMLASIGRRMRMPSSPGKPRGSLKMCRNGDDLDDSDVWDGWDDWFIICTLWKDVEFDFAPCLMSCARTRHQSLCEGAEFFDNRYFEISNNEAGRFCFLAVL